MASTNARMRGKIRHEEWPRIAERFQRGETLAEIARSYGCTPPAIRYIVGRAGGTSRRGQGGRFVQPAGPLAQEAERSLPHGARVGAPPPPVAPL